MESILILGGVFIAALLILYYLPLGIWLTALVSGVRVTMMELILMRIRRIPPAIIVQALIMAHKGGVPLTREQLEAHYLAGGNVSNVVYGLISAKRAGLKLSFEKATAPDLRGIDLPEAVKAEIAKQDMNQ